MQELNTRLEVPIRVEPTGTRRVGKTRVTLDTVIGAYWLGYTPEQITESYSAVSLSEVYTVLAWYLNNRAEVDAYLAKREKEAEEIRRRIEERQGTGEGLKAKLLARLAARKAQ